MIGNLASFRQSPAEFLMTFDRAAIIFQGIPVDRARQKYLFWAAALYNPEYILLLLKFNQSKYSLDNFYPLSFGIIFHLNEQCTFS